MYTKIKNTLSALTVAIGALALGYGLGEPIPASYAAPAAVTLELSTAVAGNTAAAATPAPGPAVGRRAQGFKRQLAMPFIAIVPLLSRRGA